MENQELFNFMMEKAVVYLQEKGYLPKSAAESTKETDENYWNDPKNVEKETKILRNAGLLPRK